MSTWIPISERLPTREDADEQERVVWRWADGATLISPYFDLRDEDHGHSFHDDFKDIMAARGIEVGE